MNILTILAVAFAPGIFWLWYFYKKDKLEPEPKRLIIKTFFLGMLVALPVILAEAPLLGSKFWLAVAGAPIIEECAKYFVVRLAVYGKVEFNGPMDGIVYAAAAALGFASLENVGYLLSAYLEPQNLLKLSQPVSPLGTVVTVFVVRALLSVPGHALFSSMWGYTLVLAKFAEPERAKRLVLKGLILAFVLHGLFNLLLVNVLVAAAGVLILVPVMWRMVHRRIAQALAAAPQPCDPPTGERREVAVLTDQLVNSAPTRNGPLYFPVSATKLIVLSLCSFGLYDFYWFYRNWKLEQARTGDRLSPFRRAVFAPFFAYSLFKQIKEFGEGSSVPTAYSPGLLAVVFFALNASWRLPGLFSLIALLGFLPLLPVRRAVAAINLKHAPHADANAKFSGRNFVLVIVGGLLLAFAVLGTLLPKGRP